jgi:HPt (histidine-containing phosphotransfer) domain-containing protein
MAYCDLTDLKEMAMGNDEFVEKMVRVFLESTKESLDQLLQAFEEGNFDRVSALAHKIKPSIDMMGIKDLHEPIRTIEKNAKESGEQLPTLLPKLDEILNRVFVELRN